MNKTTLVMVPILAPILVVVAATIGVSAMAFTVIPQEANASSIIHNAGNGYDNGRTQASNDYHNGNSHNDVCPGDQGFSYCVGYVTGYNYEWGLLNLATGSNTR